MAISVCYWANYVNEKIKLRLCTCTAHYSPTVRNAKINLQNNMHNIMSTTHPNLSIYLRETYRICNFLANCSDYNRKQYKAPISLSLEVYETSSKTGSRIRILYLLTGPINSAIKCDKNAKKQQSVQFGVRLQKKSINTVGRTQISLYPS